MQQLYLSSWSWMYFPKRLLLLFRSVQALPTWREENNKSDLSLELILNNEQTAAIGLLTKSFHDGVGVQHPPLNLLHCVLTVLHSGGGCHGGVVFHQTSGRPGLFRDKLFTIDPFS